ncbi:MAG: deoxyribonuclease V [Chloroflexota bacterium]|nr:MAG: deoxyribonuclease V [Chloroflexota bacterium]
MCSLSVHQFHPWDLTPEEAVRIQQTLRDRVIIRKLDIDSLHFVAGVDVGFKGDVARAAAVVLEYPSMRLVENSVAEIPVTFPYISGLLSFREAPAILAALSQIKNLPGVIFCDGQGIAHPRRFGIACHLGLLLEIPSLGCAKSILTGRHGSLADEQGSVAELADRAEIIDAAVRTRQGVRPVYISPGHLIDVPACVKLTLACAKGYRLPEPTRLADRIASQRGPVPFA